MDYMGKSMQRIVLLETAPGSVVNTEPDVKARASASGRPELQTLHRRPQRSIHARYALSRAPNPHPHLPPIPHSHAPPPPHLHLYPHPRPRPCGQDIHTYLPACAEAEVAPVRAPAPICGCGMSMLDGAGLRKRTHPLAPVDQGDVNRVKSLLLLLDWKNIGIKYSKSRQLTLWWAYPDAFTKGTDNNEGEDGAGEREAGVDGAERACGDVYGGRRRTTRSCLTQVLVRFSLLALLFSAESCSFSIFANPNQHTQMKMHDDLMRANAS
ncbi:hypothetical protein B0H11DRAFT_2135417 [Mycena galericulata]|nr:hypothetical protein B0H11DRAFT_2135417 [Mycena galericulata]